MEYIEMDIAGYCIEEAFQLFLQEIGKPYSSRFKLLINEKEHNVPEFILKNGTVTGRTLHGPMENTNKAQFSTVENLVYKGTKKWETKYLIVWDHPQNSKLATKKEFEDKGAAVAEARIITEEKKRTTCVIIGKAPTGFERASALIRYKPSNKQGTGLYEFKTYK